MALIDNQGIIRQAARNLPDSLRFRFLEALAELETPECFAKKQFPKTNLRRVKGLSPAIYTANIDHRGSWQIHLQYHEGNLFLKRLIIGSQTGEKPESIDLISNLNEF
ncbi:MAG: hypothetical protein HC825_02460 [Oscillatoriales cyanobacterium RM1_1_9]|nr:hypothetical protein [Oscillatoriales cyanobacterium SM2_3_0]NJO47465.1 hypothetical protein [Oscillatoriales cyanobacterium RM2_1_1]NJO70860.1 hypothetical protein [Oscillatoriales cyanobacterium RM1_1_9]